MITKIIGFSTKELNILVNLNAITSQVYFIKTVFLVFFIYVTFSKILSGKKHVSLKNMFEYIILSTVPIIVTIAKNTTNSFISVSMLLFLLSCIFEIFNKNGIIYTFMITTISLAINYVCYIISVIVTFAINVIFKISLNDWMNLLIIEILHAIILTIIFKIRKFKNGFSFLQRKNNNEYMEIVMLNISVSILFIVVIISTKSLFGIRNIFWFFIVSAFIMFITVQKSLQLYYKHKLLIQDLNETKDELAKKTKEVEELEEENLNFSKKSHSLAHKQRSLEHKLQELMNGTEISKEEVGEVQDRLKEIEKDLYKNKTAIELDKTDISEIDDMLKYMQAECVRNKIDFELQIKGNIHYMTNNLITKEDLEILLADHIKNAIIAINHTDNINRSILVRLGKIDDTYSLYIYDSGIEFEKETLENLGKKPSTTHANEGGTGMGFMNTFDTLKKCKASMIIEEYNKPSKDNYTKAIIIKFDNKSEFKIKSYKQKEEVEI